MNPPDKKIFDWTESMDRLTQNWLSSPFGGYAEIPTTRRLTWRDRLASLPYNIMYYFIRPFAWLIRELWHGLYDGWKDTWEGL